MAGRVFDKVSEPEGAMPAPKLVSVVGAVA
jgi:hypothetical protein